MAGLVPTQLTHFGVVGEPALKDVHCFDNARAEWRADHEPQRIVLLLLECTARIRVPLLGEGQRDSASLCTLPIMTYTSVYTLLCVCGSHEQASCACIMCDDNLIRCVPDGAHEQNRPDRSHPVEIVHI